MMLTQLADVLRKGGLKVEEVPGWKTRGRPASTGGFNPVGVLCHHTATPKSASDAAVVRLLVGGRSDLPGPLAQLGLARDGTVYVIAAGRANHAGRAKSSGTVAAGDGNVLYIGIEAFNDGVGEVWPAEQYDAYVKLAAVLSRDVTGNSVHTVRGHKETSVTGKVDPRFNMDAFRADVEKALKPVPAPKPPKTKAEPTTYPVQHITHNVRHALKPADVTATLNRLASSTADIIVLQEMSGRRGLVEAVRDFGAYMADLPDVKGEGGCVTLWRQSDFELVRGRVFGVGAGGPVPARAAGPSHRGPEFYTITSLRHLKTRRVIHAVNLHMPPSLGIKEMRAIAEAVGRDLDERLSAFKGQVIVAGDMNTQRPLSLLDPDGNSGLVDTSEQLGSLITHEPTKRDIDRVLYRGDALEAVSQRLIPGQPSDHIPRLTRFSLKEKS